MRIVVLAVTLLLVVAAVTALGAKSERFSGAIGGTVGACFILLGAAVLAVIPTIAYDLSFTSFWIIAAIGICTVLILYVEKSIGWNEDSNRGRATGEAWAYLRAHQDQIDRLKAEFQEQLRLPRPKWIELPRFDDSWADPEDEDEESEDIGEYVHSEYKEAGEWPPAQQVALAAIGPDWLDYERRSPNGQEARRAWSKKIIADGWELSNASPEARSALLRRDFEAKFSDEPLPKKLEDELTGLSDSKEEYVQGIGSLDLSGADRHFANNHAEKFWKSEVHVDTYSIHRDSFVYGFLHGALFFQLSAWISYKIYLLFTWIPYKINLPFRR